ncbi:TetR/AcrR family transcriptional regulator [Geomicrobium sp. JCM 19055]|uniref:TetR/AcrR family transcriptional regulator n=1 Tax=Geomicrobium sp. JCM 19055 TaxID=1460649 RepID=UPI000693C3E0|nr:TetR/AcrR family transcriptional regulator [Geomicrobium sp. JCM 19055]
MKEKVIIESAKQLFIEKGFKETSMNDIVKASNSSKGNLYHHFKNKDALFLRILKEDNQSWSEEWHKEEQNYTTAEEKLYAFADYNAKKRCLRSATRCCWGILCTNGCVQRDL